MGKKKNKKLKKINSSAQTISVTESKNAKVQPENSIEKTTPAESLTTKTAGVNQYSYVRKDVTKILVLTMSAVIILIVFYLVNAQNSFLSPFGDWIYKFFNIQAL